MWFLLQSLSIFLWYIGFFFMYIGFVKLNSCFCKPGGKKIIVINALQKEKKVLSTKQKRNALKNNMVLANDI